MNIRELLPPNVRVRVTRSIMDRPRLAAPYMRLRPGFAGTRFVPEAALVVDGFPRSANSHVFYGLRLVFGPSLPVQGHTHASATLIAAVRNDVPAVLLLRDPDAAVSSFVQMVDGLPPAAAYASYARFHQSLLPVMHRILVVSFETAVGDLGKVVREVNAKFGSQFPDFDQTDRLAKAIREELEKVNRELNGGRLREAGVARPSKSRARPEKMLASLEPKAHSARLKAQMLFEILREAAV